MKRLTLTTLFFSETFKYF